MSKPSYRLDELAKEWGWSVWTIRRLIRNKKLKALRAGRSYRVTHEERLRFESRKDLSASTAEP